MATIAVWPQLGTTVTLGDATVIDEDGAVVVYTQEISDLLRDGQLLDYDPRLEPNTDPDEPPTGHAAEHLLGGIQEIEGDKLKIGDLPTHYLPIPVPPYSTDPMHLGSHLNGIGSLLNDHSIGIANNANAITALQTQVAALSPLLLPLVAYPGSTTLQASDAHKCLVMGSASAQAVTVPPNSSVAFAVGTLIEVVWYGAGALTFVKGAGVQVRSANDSLTAGARYTLLNLVKLATDEWLLLGPLA